MKINIWWIRRDLRLFDNQALWAAMDSGDSVIPVFILDPKLLASPNVSPKRLAFLSAGLKKLDQALRGRGSYLVVRRGNPVQQLIALRNETDADSIYAEEDFSPYARRRDAAVGQQLPLKLLPGLTVHRPDMVRKADGSPYTVYSPFSRHWKQFLHPEPESLLPAPQEIATPSEIVGLSIPDKPLLPKSVPFPPGEEEARRRLEVFTNINKEAPINSYADQRNRMDLSGTSGLSPYLRFGMISARQAVISALQARLTAPDTESRKGADTWLDELIWREFYIAILFHFPQVLQKSFRPAYEYISWQDDEDLFVAWCDGQTGYPVVDAAMRQLAMSGWMHNRARMITASFLVKDLLIDWRWGERWFMQNLVDGDPAANNGGWQWTAGTGTDAAPYFRIFNPVLQGKKFDPRGDYVRHWLPELALVPERFIHEPWKMPLSHQRQARCIIGEDYPEPIVDHAIARQATLAAYAQARELYTTGA